jgi:hypothetical protein
MPRRSTTMTLTNTTPEHEPTLHQISLPIGKLDVWSSKWTPQEILMSLEQMPHVRNQHNIVSFDNQVRVYLIGLLRSRLNKREAGV